MTGAISMAKELGVKKVAVPSAGNAAGAMAAYAARAGMEAFIFMPADTPRANIIECEQTGANVTLVDGLITDCGKIVAERKGAEGWFDVSTLKEPYRVEGKKTMGYEIAEQFNWELPEVILYPTGGGTGLIGMWKAFDEMEEMGWIGPKRPRMVSVQSSTCAPIVRAFENGDRFAEEFENAATVASGLRVPKAIGDFLILDALRASGGTAIAVTDADLVAAVKEIGAAEGIFAAPEGAACLPALRKMIADGSVHENETVVIFNTGAGVKILSVFSNGNWHKAARPKGTLAIDNRWSLIFSRLFYPSRSRLIYRYRGLEFLTDHAAGDANGARDLLVSDMYRQHLRQMLIPLELTVLDIGANNGGFPLLLASEGFTFRKLVSVELNPKTFERLRFNLSRNFGSEVTALNAAVCGTEREIKFSAGNAGTADSIYDHAGVQNESVTDVKGITLDQAIEMFGPNAIDVCKMDIEGAEFEIFDSENASSIKNCRYLLIEIHHGPNRNRDRVRNRLRSLDFVEIGSQPSDERHHVHLFEHQTSTRDQT